MRRTSLRTLLVLAAAALTAAAVAVGCAGILGLDETTLRAGDASTSDSVAPPDAPGDGDARATMDGPADGGGDAGADAEAGSPVFTTKPPSILLHADASVQVEVDAVRNGLAGALQVTFTQLPAGVTSTTGAMAADASTTQVMVAAAANAAPAFGSASLQANGQTYATVPVAVYGPSGTIDSTFGGGYVLDKSDPAGSLFTSVAVDAMSRVVAGGTSGANGGGWLLRRYAEDGTPDSAFDTAASAALPGNGSLLGLAIDAASGNIVCVGTSTVSSSMQLTIAVVDGTTGNLSGSFNGGTAFAFTPVDAQSSSGNAVVVDAMQRLTVAGVRVEGVSEAYLTVPIPENTANVANIGAYWGPADKTSFTAAALDPAGRLVATGVNTGSPPTSLVARFSDGGLDPGFGDAGLTTTGAFFCSASALAVLPDSGTIVAAGSDYTIDFGCFAAWDKNGKLVATKDGSQGGGGLFTYPGAAPMGDPADHVYVVGYGGDSNARSAELDRLDPALGFDPTFGNGGSAKMGDMGSPPQYWYTLKAVAVQPDGRIVIAGSKTDVNAGTYAVLGRYWP